LSAFGSDVLAGRRPPFEPELTRKMTVNIMTGYANRQKNVFAAGCVRKCILISLKRETRIFLLLTVGRGNIELLLVLERKTLSLS
jgi:hypothetical protein